MTNLLSTKKTMTAYMMVVVHFLKMMMLFLASWCAALSLCNTENIQDVLENTLIFVFIIEFDNTININLSGRIRNIKIKKNFGDQKAFDII